ncbi:MAG: hypothetical protein KGL12_11425 [Rhodospirillales bacterium]|nr:hypothetical protein [Rhodospirillales bacterium]
MTFQIEDLAQLSGRACRSLAFPLRPWLRAHPDIGERLAKNCKSSGCWRGYQASWAIEDGALWLTRLRSPATTWLGFSSRYAGFVLDASLHLQAGWGSGDLPLLDVDVRSAAGADRRYSARLHLLSVRNGVVEGHASHKVRCAINPLTCWSIKGAPPSLGLAGDDWCWGVCRRRNPWPGNPGDIGLHPYIYIPEEWGAPLYEDTQDRWGVAAALRAAGMP